MSDATHVPHVSSVLAFMRGTRQFGRQHEVGVANVKIVVGALFGTLMAVGAAEPAASRTSYVPFVLRQVSGTRPFVKAKLNGVPLLMMVHSNADFYVMTTHSNAALAGLRNLKSRSHYGIVTHGKVSELGRAEAQLASLRVGPTENRDVALAVFETPQKPVMQGMLGVQWLRANRVVVDYARKTLGFPQTEADASDIDAELRGQGYVAHPMTYHPDRRNYTVQGLVAGLDVPIQVSTVAENVIGLPIAQRLGLAMKQQKGEAGGPAGSVQATYSSPNSVPLCLGGRSWSVDGAVIYDQSVYAGKPGAASDVPASVTLGADFMLKYRAVIDYASDTLYVLGARGRPSAC